MKRKPMDDVQVRDVIGTPSGLGTVKKIQRSYLQPEFTRLDCELQDGVSEAVILNNEKEVMLHHRPFQGSDAEYLAFLDKMRDLLDDVDMQILSLRNPKSDMERAEAKVLLKTSIVLLQDQLDELLLSFEPSE